MLGEKNLNNTVIGSLVVDLDETDSTNDLAYYLALAGFKDGTVVTAKAQRNGRGRRGNHWHSPEGGLYCSIILRPCIAPKDAFIIERLAGISVYRTAFIIINKKPTLKAPNDILIGKRKVAGILLESRGVEDRLDFIIVGIGINCSTDINLFPDPLSSKVVSLSDVVGGLILPKDVLPDLLDSFNSLYNAFLSDELTGISVLWERLVSKGDSCQMF